MKTKIKQNSSFEQNNRNKLGFGKAQLPKTDSSTNQFSWRNNNRILDEHKYVKKYQVKTKGLLKNTSNQKTDQKTLASKTIQRENHKIAINEHQTFANPKFPENNQDKIDQLDFLGRTTHKPSTLDTHLENRQLSNGFNFSPFEVARETLKLVLEKNLRQFGKSDNLTLIIVFLHRGIRRKPA